MIVKRKVDAFNLQEMLTVLAIIGILLMMAMPVYITLISNTKSTDAKIQLKYLYNNQMTHRYLNSRYTINMSELDFELPKTTKENGTANYVYEIISATDISFKARATAINDFDGDGTFNVWEIEENGIPKQIVKD